MGFLVWDKYEELSVKLLEFEQILMNYSGNNAVFLGFCAVKDLVTELFDTVFMEVNFYQLDNERLADEVCKCVVESDKCARKYEEVKLNNKVLVESLLVLKQLVVKDLKTAEKCKKNLQSAHEQFSHKYKLKLKQLENELFSLTTERTSPGRSITDISSEFQQFFNKDTEKNTETLSFSLNYSDSQELFSSHKKLIDSDSSFDLNGSHEKMQKNCMKSDENGDVTSESLMLIKQLLEIKFKDKFKEAIEKTTPMSSFYQNSSEAQISFNIPGHRRNKHFLRVQDLEVNL